LFIFKAINLLKDKLPGTFLIRDSNNFPGAYGLALKVDKPPPNIQIKPGTDPMNELVRHFLIEPTTKGVRIKGCCNEPIFGSLAALVYQHSLTPLALPCKLILPDRDLTPSSHQNNSNDNKKAANGVSTAGAPRVLQNGSASAQQSQQKQQIQQQLKDGAYLLERGAACNVFYLSSMNVDSRNGLDAITHALMHTKSFQQKDSSQLLLVQFKVTAQGITLTDINKKRFASSRLHFPTSTVVYCAVDEKLTWPCKLEKISQPRIFGVVCRPKVNSGPNECHLFIELDPDQPAIAIVDFINRYLIPSKLSNLNNKN
jgi:tensin